MRTRHEGTSSLDRVGHGSDTHVAHGAALVAVHRPPIRCRGQARYTDVATWFVEPSALIFVFKGFAGGRVEKRKVVVVLEG